MKRKKIDFYSKDFVEVCKELIRKYGGGEFSRGIFYTVKGVRDSDDAIMFDFRIVASRVVSAVQKPKKRTANGRIAGKRGGTSSGGGRQEQGKNDRQYNSMAGHGQSLSGFSVPAMGRTF